MTKGYNKYVMFILWVVTISVKWNFHCRIGKTVNPDPHFSFDSGKIRL